MNKNNNILENSHALSKNKIFNILESTKDGLSILEAQKRLKQYGSNIIPEGKNPSFIHFFIKQFTNPLIYILLIAVVFSLVIQQFYDALFISVVLLLNAIIGTTQEYSAHKAALALRQLVITTCRVLRAGESYEINSKELVPGDIVLLESGDKIPADIRLLSSHDFEVDESLLTGESIPISKEHDQVLPIDCILNDRINMVFAGTMVNRGRAQGIVVSTGLNTKLGHIASSVLQKAPPKPPLTIRLEKFTNNIAISIGIISFFIAAMALMQNMQLTEVFMVSIALAVSVIPEGLPVAVTVALAISMRRMANRNVIVRKLVAVEALGSCTYIATDKTGTLTKNELEVSRIIFPEGIEIELETNNIISSNYNSLLENLCQTAVLANEGFYGLRNNEWVCHGDQVDISLLKMAHKYGFVRSKLLNIYTEVATIPFESAHKISASLNKFNNTSHIFVKGAVEQVLSMCDKMATKTGNVIIDPVLLESQAEQLAKTGYRVIAFATGEESENNSDEFTKSQLKKLTFIGLVGIIDPIRKETKSAIDTCHNAGIKVAMLTGDHPSTALAIAKKINLIDTNEQVVTGVQMKAQITTKALDKLITSACIFARIEPTQKLNIVQSLQKNGYFVAVSGDGVNDAPALRAAEVGVAMGKKGSSVAKESSELIITDDNFSSIVAGIEEGRIAYSNIRKVIFLLISTGAAELVLFILAFLAGLPLPLMAVQLLWLNLVTNGIQDIALAFEPAEGMEMKKPPRKPKELIFNKIMLERIVISAFTIGIFAFIIFYWLLLTGVDINYARNMTLLLMVLFENVHVLNSRSETKSIFKHNIMLNPILIIGTIAAQLVHIAAMYIPWLKDVLKIEPVSIQQWLVLLCIALFLIVVIEAHKLIRKYFPIKN